MILILTFVYFLYQYKAKTKLSDLNVNKQARSEHKLLFYFLNIHGMCPLIEIRCKYPFINYVTQQSVKEPNIPAVIINIYFLVKPVISKLFARKV